MKIAICPGSFDPVTNGHLDVVERAAQLFDKVIVLVMVNAEKHPLFTLEERVELIRCCITHLPNVEVDCFDGLLAEYAKQKQANAIVKGLRALSDYDYEFQMALTNRKLNPELETVFLAASADRMYLSSSLVKQVAQYGGAIDAFVPACILEPIEKKFRKDG